MSPEDAWSRSNSTDELARLLAGETITVATTVGAEHGETLPVTPDAAEPEALPEDAGEPVTEVPASVPSPEHSTSLDDPPAGTEPITRSIDVAPGEAVVAYIRGRWRDAVVAQRDIGSLLVTYSPRRARSVRFNNGSPRSGCVGGDWSNRAGSNRSPEPSPLPTCPKPPDHCSSTSTAKDAATPRETTSRRAWACCWT